MTDRNLQSDGRMAIFYEHPEWFNSLFAELHRRGVRYERLLAHEHRFDPAGLAV